MNRSTGVLRCHQGVDHRLFDAVDGGEVDRVELLVVDDLELEAWRREVGHRLRIGRVLFLHDVRRFAAKARPLAIEPRRMGVKVVLLTDEFCPWGPEVADICLVVPGAHGPLWDGSATIIAVMDLMLSNIIVVLGNEVSDRVELLTRLQDKFDDFEA